MTMPGFTAEASVYKTSEHYQMKAFYQAEKAVHPSSGFNRLGPIGICQARYDDCLANAQDITDNCFCHNALGFCLRGFGLRGPFPQVCPIENPNPLA